MRELTVYWVPNKERIRVGRLIESKTETLYFEWDKEFLQSNIELSPLNFRKQPGLVECPREPFRGLPGLLADCVPDGWAQGLIRLGLASKGIVTTEISPLDVLSFLGRDSIGALTFEPELRKDEETTEAPLALFDLEGAIPKILEGTPSDLIQAFLDNGSSPNGARPKILLKERNGKFYSESSNFSGDGWLIKFKATEDPPYIAELEYIYSLMAKEGGLDVPETRLFENRGRRYFGTRRFDRVGDQRFHVHTLSGILHTPPTNFSVGYEHFAKVVQYLTKDTSEVLKALRLAVFNVLASNQDDHTKNISLLMNGKGGWGVAPAYDLTFHTTRFNQHKMHVLGNGQPDNDTLAELFNQFGYSKKTSREVITQIADAISTFSKKALQYGIPKAEVKKIEKTLNQRALPRRVF